MSEKIKLYTFFLDDIQEDDVFGFRYLATCDPKKELPRLASYDMVHIAEKDLIEYAKLVEEADPEITYFLFEIEGTGECVTGKHALTGLANCDSFETADAAADDASSFEEVTWDTVLSRSQAMAMFEMPHPSFVPIIGSNYRFQ